MRYIVSLLVVVGLTSVASADHSYSKQKTVTKHYRAPVVTYHVQTVEAAPVVEAAPPVVYRAVPVYAAPVYTRVYASSRSHKVKTKVEHKHHNGRHSSSVKTTTRSG